MGEIDSERAPEKKLLRGVVGLPSMRGRVTQSEKPFGRVFFEKQPAFKRPPLVAIASGRIVQVDAARDVLRSASHHIVLGIARRIRKIAEVPAGPQDRINRNVRSDDLPYLLMLVAEQEDGQ